MDNFMDTVVNWFGGTTGSELPSMIPLAIFLSALCLLEGAYLFLSERKGANEKIIKERLRFVEKLEGLESAESLIKADQMGEKPFLQNLIGRITKLFSLDILIAQAGLSWQTSTFICVSLIMGVAGLGIGYSQMGSMGALAGFGGGMFLAYFFLIAAKKRRIKKFEKQLPDALGLMARSMKAGHSFPAGLQLVADEMPNPIGMEFFKVFKEYNYGLDMNIALMNLYTRIELRDLKFFVTAVMIQRETGGNLVEILDKISSLIRERFKLVGSIQALTAEGRFSGLILIALAPALGGVMYGINPDYIRLLFYHPLGHKLLMGGLFFQLVGFLAIRKIVNIKV
jgi:tight adherence protein B